MLYLAVTQRVIRLITNLTSTNLAGATQFVLNHCPPLPTFSKSSRGVLVYKKTKCSMLLIRFPGYLIAPERPAMMVSIFQSRDHRVPSFLLFLHNSENLRIWYSDPLQIAILACGVLVRSDDREEKGPT